MANYAGLARTGPGADAFLKSRIQAALGQAVSPVGGSVQIGSFWYAISDDNSSLTVAKTQADALAGLGFPVESQADAELILASW